MNGPLRRPATLVASVALVLVSACALEQHDGSEGGLAQAELTPSSGGAAVDLGSIPLTGIRVRANVQGSLADVSVEQTYENRLEARIEAVYVFPLPDDAAVHEMVMVIGERRIRADLRERDEARQTYERARAAGQTTSLLEQERPNIFTMSVANIEPGVPIRVLLRYVEELPYSDGQYRFHFPTTVGPRFIPGTPEGRQGTGRLADTDQVPDASRITPATLPEGTRTPYEVDFKLDLAAGVEIHDIDSSSHNLDIRAEDDRLTAQLRPGDRQPNRDIELSYALADDEPAFAFLTHYDAERGGYFTLTFEPPRELDEDDVRPKEMFFVLDTSGSMMGFPIETAKEAMRHALRNMNDEDTFQIVRFSDAASTLSPEPLPNTPANVRRGIEFIDDLRGGGGTVMTAGIRAALSGQRDPNRLRVVLFMTDGYIGNESQILELIDREVGSARLFSMGIGSSVNRFLLDRMAERGRGTVHYVNIGEKPDDVVAAFYDRIRNPVLTDVEVDFGGMQVSGLIPEAVPDVFAGTPIVLAGRYERGGTTDVVIRGRIGTRSARFPMRLFFPETPDRHEAISLLWARRRIEELESASFHDRTGARASVLPVALEYGLMSQYTSFVAVEERISADAADPLRTVGVPVALPAGVSEQGIGPQVLDPSEVASSGQLGFAGTGRGGGGSGGGTIGLGNLLSIGHGGGGGSGSGYGRGAGGLRGGLAPRMARSRSDNRYGIQGPANAPARAAAEAADPSAAPVRGHRASTPVIRTGSATVSGNMSRDVIRRYIRRHISQLRFCYEQRVVADPSLAGVIVVRFIIGADGSVASAAIASSTMGDEAVEQCLLRAIQRIAFPQPEGGGMVVVSYPFQLQSSQ